MIVRSRYSLDGTRETVEGLCRTAKAMGLPWVALVDRMSVAGVVELAIEAQKVGVKPVIGAELSVGPDGARIVLLVETQAGWTNLVGLLNEAVATGETTIPWETLAARNEGLIAIVDVSGGESDFSDARRAFPSESIVIEARLDASFASFERCESALVLAKRLAVPAILTGTQCFFSPSGRGIFLSMAGSLGDSAREALERFETIADRCVFDISLGRRECPPFPVTEGESGESVLRRIVSERLTNHLRKVDGTKAPSPGVYRDRVMQELRTIVDLGFCDYFLYLDHLLAFARGASIPLNMASAEAYGSLVLFLLEATSSRIDPMVEGLSFDLFMLPGRRETPNLALECRSADREMLVPLVSAASRSGVSCGFARYEDESGKLMTVPESDPAWFLLLPSGPADLGLPLARSSSGDLVCAFPADAVSKMGSARFGLVSSPTMDRLHELLETRKRRQGGSLDPDSIPLDDDQVVRLFASGCKEGIPHFDSSWMASLCRKTSPTRFGHLVDIVALDHPEPIKHDLEIKYRNNLKKEKKGGEIDCHPLIAPFVTCSHGVLLYQEQVLQLAMEYGGLSAFDADCFLSALHNSDKGTIDELIRQIREGMSHREKDSGVVEAALAELRTLGAFSCLRAHAVVETLLAWRIAWFMVHFPEPPPPAPPDFNDDCDDDDE